MKLSPRHQKAANLSHSVRNRLNSYALAATAAGVGALALAQPADARIIYTKVHHVIGFGTSYDLDLNHDGTIDFVFKHVNAGTSGQNRDILSLAPAAGNGFLLGMRTDCKTCPALVISGYGITSVGHFSGKSVVLAHASALLGSNTFWGGRWADVSNGYLGLKFKIGSETHYGWARLSVRERVHGVQPIVTPTITGYAYETIPDTGIIAGRTHGTENAEPAAFRDANTPKPGALGMLAVGRK
jgi:hypothetical protein